MKERFTHKVSKGSRFNQVYIPNNMSQIFEPGDIVEVKLIKKNLDIYFRNFPMLSEFKTELIKRIFSFLRKFNEIEQIFIFGSFLTKREDYNDIDLFLISENDTIKDQVYDKLTECINLKFHIVTTNKENFMNLLKICPLTRSMLFYSASNKKMPNIPQINIDKKHIMFLLMFPEDLLKTKLDETRPYYNALRRLIVIDAFLRRREIAPDSIDSVIAEELGNNIYMEIKDNYVIDKLILNKIKTAIKKKLNKIHEKI